jgi:hypothetical protein
MITPFHAVERAASQPTGSLGEAGVGGGWLASLTLSLGTRGGSAANEVLAWTNRWTTQQQPDWPARHQLPGVCGVRPIGRRPAARSAVTGVKSRPTRPAPGPGNGPGHRPGRAAGCRR